MAKEWFAAGETGVASAEEEGEAVAKGEHCGQISAPRIHIHVVDVFIIIMCETAWNSDTGLSTWEILHGEDTKGPVQSVHPLASSLSSPNHDDFPDAEFILGRE